MEKIKEQHGLVQAHAESGWADPMAARVGTKLFRDGHRKGFWDGTKHTLLHLSEFAEHVDWRPLAGFVGGRLFARWLRVGDLVEVSGIEGHIESHKIIASSVVLFTVRTASGRRVDCTRALRDEVRVLSYAVEVAA